MLHIHSRIELLKIGENFKMNASLTDLILKQKIFDFAHLMNAKRRKLNLKTGGFLFEYEFCFFLNNAKELLTEDQYVTLFKSLNKSTKSIKKTEAMVLKQDVKNFYKTDVFYKNNNGAYTKFSLKNKLSEKDKFSIVKGNRLSNFVDYLCDLTNDEKMKENLKEFFKTTYTIHSGTKSQVKLYKQEQEDSFKKVEKFFIYYRKKIINYFFSGKNNEKIQWLVAKNKKSMRFFELKKLCKENEGMELSVLNNCIHFGDMFVLSFHHFDNVVSFEFKPKEHQHTLNFEEFSIVKLIDDFIISKKHLFSVSEVKKIKKLMEEN